MDEAGCTFNDERLQYAVMRDPRAVTVSSYFYRVRKPLEFDTPNTLDDYFQQMLAPFCVWTSIRYLIFTQLLADQSQVFYMEDLVVDPTDWYGRFLSFVGLSLPRRVIDEMMRDTSARLGKGYNEHPGGGEPGSSRSFRDELGPQSLAMMDDVMRSWLPPVLLQRFGISQHPPSEVRVP